MALINRLIEKAKKNPKRVAISECDSERNSWDHLLDDDYVNETFNLEP